MHHSNSYGHQAPMPPPPSYVMLNNNNNPYGNANSMPRPPPDYRNIPRYHTKKKSNKGCLKCLCCCCCFLFILILALLGTTLYIFIYHRPRVPTYKFENMSIGAFDAQMDFSLYAEFIITVKAENPNTIIAFIYGEDSSVVVEFQDSVLCSGKLPAFYQGYQNTTVMNVALSGKSTFGSGLQEALMSSRHAGRVPLLVMVRVPVTMVMADFQMSQVYVLVNATLVVDKLSPKTKPNILSSNYSVGVRYGTWDLSVPVPNI